MIEIVNGGPLTLVQDGGRRGWQQSGVPIAGALDRDSLRIANLLCGNQPDAPALEVAYAGLRLRFTVPTAVAVVGGELGATIGGRPCPPLCACVVAAGEELVLTGGGGLRTYVAFAGGLMADVFLGSSSAYLRGGFPGTTGRPLRAGDRLQLRRVPGSMEVSRLTASAVPAWFAATLAPARAAGAVGQPLTLRVVLGPQEDHFDAAGISHFLSETWHVTRETDRMGCRLAGSPLPGERIKQIISDGAANGSIQVPGNGLPIILLADRQPTGGYPKIATVISTDLPLLAHCQPEATLRFAAVDFDAALEQARERDAAWRQVSFELASARADRQFTLTRDGRKTRVAVERLE